MMDTHIDIVTKEEIRAARVTGLYEYLEACHHDDFKNVFDFNTRQTVNALGTAVSSITSRICKEIELVIVSYRLDEDED